MRQAARYWSRDGQDPDTFFREQEQQLERVRICFAAVGAEPALSRQVIPQELRDGWCKRLS
jgi:hypothetical protein